MEKKKKRKMREFVTIPTFLKPWQGGGQRGAACTDLRPVPESALGGGNGTGAGGREGHRGRNGAVVVAREPLPRAPRAAVVAGPGRRALRPGLQRPGSAAGWRAATGATGPSSSRPCSWATRCTTSTAKPSPSSCPPSWPRCRWARTSWVSGRGRLGAAGLPLCWVFLWRAAGFRSVPRFRAHHQQPVRSLRHQ